MFQACERPQSTMMYHISMCVIALCHSVAVIRPPQSIKLPVCLTMLYIIRSCWISAYKEKSRFDNRWTFQRITQGKLTRWSGFVKPVKHLSWLAKPTYEQCCYATTYLFAETSGPNASVDRLHSQRYLVALLHETEQSQHTRSHWFAPFKHRITTDDEESHTTHAKIGLLLTANGLKRVRKL